MDSRDSAGWPYPWFLRQRWWVWVTDFNKELIAFTIAPGNHWINPFLKVPISMTPIEYQMDIWDRLALKHGYFSLNVVLGDLRHPVSKVWDLHVKFNRPNGWFLSPVPYDILILPRYSELGIQPLSIVIGCDGALSYLLTKHATARDTCTTYTVLVEKIFASQGLFVLWLECCVCDVRDWWKCFWLLISCSNPFKHISL